VAARPDRLALADLTVPAHCLGPWRIGITPIAGTLYADLGDRDLDQVLVPAQPWAALVRVEDLAPSGYEDGGRHRSDGTTERREKEVEPPDWDDSRKEEAPGVGAWGSPECE